jgi:hypothetical protein
LFVTFGLAGAIGLGAGCFAVVLATRLPAQRARLQDAGGFLVVGGLALLGLAFAMV